LWGFWRTFFKPDSSFWMAFMFQDRSSVCWWWWTFRVTKHHQNDRKCWKNSRTHPWSMLPNNPWARRRRWDQLCSLLWDLNRKFEHMPHYHKVCSPTLDKRSKSAPRKYVSWATREAKQGPRFYLYYHNGWQKWIYGYDPGTKLQLQWKSPQSPRVEKACQVWSST
jgi:hypothetical protein